ncbi:uncharacterized protein KY384_005147 [Bacidia gigantensis]|uniref:uncharacterized protein n=1 Tax=Bacidia gigantensis TaxID=2732470 RepID=UPI001D037320|nr:uncharacterized protein KY384_005147 [Bacidia gigantensis]KAG8529666.1 hypothetical protein KY384_005147 [Bacidia gigantensis]
MRRPSLSQTILMASTLTTALPTSYRLTADTTEVGPSTAPQEPAFYFASNVGFSNGTSSYSAKIWRCADSPATVSCASQLGPDRPGQQRLDCSDQDKWNIRVQQPTDASCGGSPLECGPNFLIQYQNVTGRAIFQGQPLGAGGDWESDGNGGMSITGYAVMPGF